MHCAKAGSSGTSTKCALARPCCRAPRSFDWWGINYYTRVGINWRFQRVGLHPSEPITDMHMPMCACDLGYHIRQAAAFGRPLYVTETGIADREDKHRARLIDEYYGKVGDVVAAVYSGLRAAGMSAVTACRAAQPAAGGHVCSRLAQYAALTSCCLILPMNPSGESSVDASTLPWCFGLLQVQCPAVTLPLSSSSAAARLLPCCGRASGSGGSG